jgi:hypothetical protein
MKKMKVATEVELFHPPKSPKGGLKAPRWGVWGVLLCVLCVSSANARFSPSPHQSIIDSSLTLALNQEYDSLFSLFQALGRKNPQNPLFDFYQMLACEAKMIDYETTAWVKAFDSLGARAERGFKKIMKREKRNPWIYYFLGNFYVTRGAHELRFSNYLNFSRNIFKGIGLIRKSVKLDSTLYDAYLYLGTYEYAKAEIFKWVPFMEDEKEEALGMIRLAMEKSLFSRQTAVQVLVGIYGHMGDVANAEKIALDFKARYPQNRAIYWLMGNVYLSKKLYARARAEFEALEPMLSGIPREYDYNTASLNAILSRVTYNLGDYRACAARCGRVLACKSGDHRMKKLKKVARKYKARAEKRLAGGGK